MTNNFLLWVVSYTVETFPTWPAQQISIISGKIIFYIFEMKTSSKNDVWQCLWFWLLPLFNIYISHLYSKSRIVLSWWRPGRRRSEHSVRGRAQVRTLWRIRQPEQSTGQSRCKKFDKVKINIRDPNKKKHFFLKKCRRMVVVAGQYEPHQKIQIYEKIII